MVCLIGCAFNVWGFVEGVCKIEEWIKKQPVIMAKQAKQLGGWQERE